MGKVSDAQLHKRIEGILKRHPNASSIKVRQRLMVDLRQSNLYVHLIPFYRQNRIDDSQDIQREISRMMRLSLGLSEIARTLSSSCYNYLQVEKALLDLTAEFDHFAQAQRCKDLRFGSGSPRDEDHQSEMVIGLQKLGHRLPDIWRVLRHANKRFS